MTRTREARSGSTAHRIWRYLPLAVWLAIIALASSNQMSASETSRFVAPLVRLFFPDITRESLALVHLAVRKTAHFVEYAVLALLAARAFLTSSRTALRRRPHSAAFVLVAVCALLDEYHQSFVASRTGTIYDSLIDMSGGLTALAFLHLWRTAERRIAT